LGGDQLATGTLFFFERGVHDILCGISGIDIPATLHRGR
jgi:hypothetical protein